MREEQEADQDVAQAPKRRVGVLAMPHWLRWLFSVILFFVIVICLFLYVAYIINPTGVASPVELGLSGLLIFCIATLVIIHIPWHELGYRVKRVGAFEFEQALHAQTAERAEEIGYLGERLAMLEIAFESELEKKSFQGSEIFRQMYEPQLRKLLLDFFSANEHASFSPLRIKAWGSTQPGFKSLENFEVGFIRHILGKMVAERVLETVLSKKGNTLYRIAE